MSCRELRRKRLVDAAMRKHGLKSASKKTALLAAAEDEAEETLDFLDSRAQLGEERVRGVDLSVKLKYRQDKEERLASVLEGAPRALNPVPLTYTTTLFTDLDSSEHYSD